MRTVWDIIKSPVITEKALVAKEESQDSGQLLTFRVDRRATKPEIKAAVELMFGTKDKKIEVLSVQVSNVKGKEKRFGRFMGRRNNWKKAYVSLKPGQEINFAAGENK